jgi:hypothetical protein
VKNEVVLELFAPADAAWFARVHDALPRYSLEFTLETNAESLRRLNGKFPVSPPFENPERFGYKLRARTLAEHRERLTRSTWTEICGSAWRGAATLGSPHRAAKPLITGRFCQKIYPLGVGVRDSHADFSKVR